MSASTDTVIIGAGAAGLSAAAALHKKNRDVIVLEARDRIGAICEREKLATVDIVEHRRPSEGGQLRNTTYSAIWGTMTSF